MKNRRLNNKKGNKKIVIILLLLLVTIGYAFLSANLNINGLAILGGNPEKFDIHFENIVPNSKNVVLGDNDQEATISQDDNTNINFSVSLNKPGDFYEFNVDVVNKGNVDGMVESINTTIKINDEESFTVLSDKSNLPPYLDLFITYSDGSEIVPKHGLAVGDTETYKVRIEFKKDIEEDDLPKENIVIENTFGVDYIKADDTTSFKYKYGFFSNDDIFLTSYTTNDKCPAFYEDRGYSSEESERICNGERIDGYGIEDDLLYDSYTLINEGIINDINVEIDNSSTNYNNLKRKNFIKYNNDLSDNYFCTLINSKNGNPACFNGKDIDQEINKLKELFGEENCDSYEEEISCNISSNTESWYCGISNSYMGCDYEKGNYYESCNLSEEGFECEGSKINEEDDSPFITEITSEGLAALSYDVNKNKCIQEFNSWFDDKEKTNAFCNGETIDHDGYTYSLKKELSYGIEMYVEEGIIKNVKYGRPTSYEINYEGCINYLHNEGETDESQIELYCTGNTATIFGDEQNLKEMLDEEMSEGYTYELIEYENYGVINVNYQETKPNRIITGYEGTPPKDLVIPSTLNGGRVVEIGWGAFQDMGLENVVIPNTVTYIGSYAFDNNNLNTVNLDNENTSVNYCSFGKKKTITTHNLPEDYYCETIYWALQDNDNNGTNETLVLSSNELNGNKKGSFEGNQSFWSSNSVPWISATYNNSNNLSYNVTNVIVEDEIKPQYTAYWFNGVGFNSTTINYDLSKLNTSKVTNMYQMFAYTGYNTEEFELDLSNFDTSNVYNMSYMFNNCRNLETIFVSNKFKTDKVNNSSYMFTGATKIIGGAGTVYDSNHIDKEYAHIDGEDNNSGYFVKKGSITIILNPNGGNVVRNVASTEIGEEIGALPIPTKEGFYFDGWYTNLENGEKVSKNYIPNTDMEIFAKWKKSIQSAIIESNSITITAPSQNKTINIINSQEIEEDYSFYIENENIAFVDKTGKISPIAEGTTTMIFLGSISNQTISVSINVNYIRYNVIFNPNGGNVSPESKKVIIESNIGDLPVPTKEYHEFIGWYTSLDSGEQITEQYIPNNNIELYARWVDLRYTIRFDKNNDNAIGIMDNQKKIEDINLALSKNTYTLEGYAFVGWNTESDGSGISYLDEEEISINDDITLYAQWHKTYVLTFDNNNNDATSESYTNTLLSDIQTEIPRESFNIYKLNNMMIESWNTEPDYSGETYIRGQNITINKDTTLYAKWVRTEITNTIYWALQDNDNNETNETLLISSNEVQGIEQGSFSANKVYTSSNRAPWNLNSLSKNVTDIDVIDVVTPKSTSSWFEGISSSASVFKADLSYLNTSKVIDMNHMFYQTSVNSEDMELIGLDNWDTSNVTNMSYMFSGSGKNATTWNIGNLDNWDTSNVTNMSYMFGTADYKSGAGYNAKTWNIGNLDNWNTSKVTNMSHMFSGSGTKSTTWNIGNLDNWKTSNVTNMSYMFGVWGGTSGSGYSAKTWNIGNLDNWDTSNVTDTEYMFSGSGAASSTWNIGNIGNWNTSKVTNMRYMFYRANLNVDEIDWNLSNWNTSSVTDMEGMFNSFGYNAKSFNLNLNNWNTSNVETIMSMFRNAGNNAKNFNLEISDWNTSNVTNMTYTFYDLGFGATSFNLDLSNWNTTNLIDMRETFRSAGYWSKDFNLNLSNWDTSNVTDMYQLFYEMGGASTTFNLDISNWNTSNVEDMTNMFGIGYYYGWYTYAGQKATNFELKIPTTNGNGINNTTKIMYGKQPSISIGSPKDVNNRSRDFTLSTN